MKIERVNSAIFYGLLVIGDKLVKLFLATVLDHYPNADKRRIYFQFHAFLLKWRRPLNSLERKAQEVQLRGKCFTKSFGKKIHFGIDFVLYFYHQKLKRTGEWEGQAAPAKIIPLKPPSTASFFLDPKYVLPCIPIYAKKDELVMISPKAESDFKKYCETKQPWERARGLIQAVDIVKYLAAQGLSHGDIKGENFVWYKNRVCLIDTDDVGSSKRVSNTYSKWYHPFPIENQYRGYSWFCEKQNVPCVPGSYCDLFAVAIMTMRQLYLRDDKEWKNKIIDLMKQNDPLLQVCASILQPTKEKDWFNDRVRALRSALQSYGKLSKVSAEQKGQGQC